MCCKRECAYVCVCAHAHRLSVHLLIKCRPDRNVVLYSVHLEHNATQKLFLTCTLCSIWSHSGGGRQGSSEEAQASSPEPHPYLFSVTYSKNQTCIGSVFCGIESLVRSDSLHFAH